MFIRLSALLPITALTTVVVAQGGIINSCNTGDMMCCNDINTVTQSDRFHHSLNFFSDFIPIFDFGDLGIECNTITGIGGGDSGGACAAQPVCCENVDMNALVGIDCSPINIVA